MTKLEQLISNALICNDRELPMDISPLIGKLSSFIKLEKEEYGLELLNAILLALKEPLIQDIYGVVSVQSTQETIPQYYARLIQNQINDLNFAKAHYELASLTTKFVTEYKMSSIEVARLISEKATKLLHG